MADSIHQERRPDNTRGGMINSQSTRHPTSTPSSPTKSLKHPPPPLSLAAHASTSSTRPPQRHSSPVPSYPHKSQRGQSGSTSGMSSPQKPKIWWSNAIFFVGFHVFAVVGVTYLKPPSTVPWQTWILCFISWQLASFGITIGYHRLWSHKAFTATMPLRIVLAWMGALGYQGSIKWWTVRHRLHHRYTDDPIHDPYSATKGLWFAHCGWIFFKPRYPRLPLIEKDDLESDPVVRFQHKYFVYIALFSGLVTPTMLAKIGWGDALGGYVWGGLVARLLIWHTTFCINSLAHWTGLQPYTEEVTARGNYLLALLTSGEGNHNYHHAFPRDFRNGPHPQDWDPTKWIIWVLHRYTNLVPTLHTTPKHEILKARAHVHHSHAVRLQAQVPDHEKVKDDSELPVWTISDVLKAVRSQDRILLLINGYIVDASAYAADHPGGARLLQTWSVRPTTTASRGDKKRALHSPSPTDSGYESGSLSGASSPRADYHNDHSSDESIDAAFILKDATKPFFGEINNHSAAAKEKMRVLVIARYNENIDGDS